MAEAVLNDYEIAEADAKKYVADFVKKLRDSQLLA